MLSVAKLTNLKVNLKTGMPSSVQIAGAIMASAFERSEEDCTALLNDREFAVSELLDSVDGEPIVQVNNYLSFRELEVDGGNRKNLNTMKFKCSELKNANSFSEKELEEIYKKYNKNSAAKPETHRVSNSRPQTKDATLFHYTIIHRETSHLLFSCSSEKNKQIIIGSLKDLSIQGVGADRSIGLGVFGFDPGAVDEFKIETDFNSKVNVSCYIPSDDSTIVKSRIKVYSPFISKGSTCAVYYHSPFGLVACARLVDGKQIPISDKKVLNFRSILLPINL